MIDFNQTDSLQVIFKNELIQIFNICENEGAD